MMKKKILLMCMALMSAMTLWAGHVFLEPDPWDPVMMHGNVGVDNLDPGPGDIVTVNVAPDPGYHLFIEDIVVIEVDENNDFIDSLTVTGPPETQVPENYTFQMPLNDHNVRVSVTFTGIEYPLNSFTGGGSGHCEVKLINGQPLDTIAFPDPHNIMARTGDTITLKVTPDLGWQLNYINLEYQGNVNLLPNTEFIMPSDPTTVVAYFNLVNLTITINNSDPNGTLSIYSINGQEGLTPPYIAHIGEDIALDFTANPGYILDHVDIVANDTVFNRTLINGEMNFDMPPCDITLIPTFKPVSYMVEIDQGPHGTIAALNTSTGIGGPGVPTVPAEMGQNIQLSNTPDIGYELDHYLATNASNGTDVLFTDGQDGASTSVNDFNMPSGNVVVTAIFKKKDYKITIDLSLAGGNGTIDVFKIDENVVPPGTPQPYYAKMDVPIELTITPAPGYELDTIYLVADETTYNRQFWEDNFDMPPSNITLRPTFRVATYNINVDQSILGGTVDAYNIPASFGYAPIVPAKMSDDIQLSNTPARGYRFDYYIVTNDNDGSDVLFSDNNPGQTTLASDFFMPGNDVNVSAVFVPNDYPIILNVLPNAAAGNVNVPPTGVYGDQIPINIQPNAGYTISQVYYEYQQGGQTVRITVPHDPGDPLDQYYFTMPAYRVTLTVVFDPDPHNLNVVTFYTGGSITVDKIDGLPQTPYQPNFYPVGTGAVVDVINTPNTGYRFVQYELTSDADNPGYQVTFTTNSFTMPYCNVNLSAKFELNQHKVVVQNALPAGEAEAWWGSIPAYDNAARIYNPIDYDGFVSLNVTACNIGYVFDHYELYDLANYPGPQLLGLWQNPPDNTDFLMPDCDVLVVPVFRKKTFYIVYDNRPNPGASLQIRNVTQGTNVLPLPAEMGDIIEMTATETPPLNNFPFDYFTFDEYDLNYQQVIGNLGEMSGHTFVSPLSYVTTFTMPPLDLLIGAYFWDPNGPTMPPPPNPIEMWVDASGNSIYRRGMVFLHRVYQKKSSTVWDEPRNYGWSEAIPGQPMYFTVMPDLGFQVNKSEITVQLVDASQGEESGKSRVIKELKGGPEIFGPDEYVTEPTDYYFIFDVPGDMDPNKVQVKIFADFNPIDYNIIVDGAIEHGTIEAPTSAKADDVVALTVTPDPGYRLESITVTPEEPGFIVSVDQNNQFVMPACNVFVTATFTEVDFLRGDANGDNEVSIADVSALIDYLLSGDESLINMDAADCNGDDDITIADVSALIDYLLTGSW